MNKLSLKKNSSIKALIYHRLYTTAIQTVIILTSIQPDEQTPRKPIRTLNEA